MDDNLYDDSTLRGNGERFHVAVETADYSQAVSIIADVIKPYVGLRRSGDTNLAYALSHLFGIPSNHTVMDEFFYRSLINGE